jgi:hypothetical protein
VQTIPPLPALRVEGEWQTTEESSTRSARSMVLRRGNDTEAAVHVERCVGGRLRDAYPVGAHDVEIQIATETSAEVLPGLLTTLAHAVLSADPSCRRVVHAVGQGDGSAVETVERAGFRYVVDIDLPDEELSLLVYELYWANVTAAELDHVPGT